MAQGWAGLRILICVPSPSTKSELREAVRARIALLSASELDEKSRDICGRVLACSLYRGARTILFYAPTPDEVDTMPIARDALEQSKRVCFPAIDWEKRSLRPVAVDSIDENAFVTHRHGIREPASGSELGPEQIDLVIVPGVAFTESGDRLGRGAGFYDRFLATCPAARLGVCFREQIVDSVQADTHDVPMDSLGTDGRDMIVVTMK